MSRPKLSEKQSEILEYIKSQILDRGFPPSVREICQAVNLKSTSSVHAHLSTLEKNGYIIIDLNMSRIMANHQLILHYTVKAPSENDFTKLLPGLQSIGKLSEFSLTD